MPGRNAGMDYRFGYEKQESDDEIYGEGNAYSFEYRMCDSRLGKFWSVDPLAINFPWNSPYAFSENRVISAIELEGLEAHDLNGEGSVSHEQGVSGPQPESSMTVNGPYKNGAVAKSAAKGGRASVNLKELDVSSSPSSALNDRADHPYKINQGGTSLCGITTLVQAFAKYDKEGYKNLVKTLYAMDLPDNEAQSEMGVCASDWVVLSGLKKLTSPFPYGNESNSGGLEGLQGLTTPEQMSAIADLLGFTTFDNTLSVFAGVGNLNDFFSNINSQSAQGKTVILLINTEVLKNKTVSLIPNHYVIYNKNSYKKYTDGCFEFNAQTHGYPAEKYGPHNIRNHNVSVGIYGALIIGK